MPAAAPDPMVGTDVGGRYRLIERLGEGGMGVVYRAEHMLMKKQVALKLLHPELGRLDDVARRFEREAQSASRLEHENIIRVTDFGRAESGSLFLVMELLRGESLADLLRREGRLPARRAVALASLILRALDHAHRAGVVHRDLKPDNVMLADRPGDPAALVVKLLDFGIAKMSGGPAAEGADRLTRAGVVFGTPHYMAPEQAAGQEVDARADLYACGVVLYQMLAGRRPFESDDLVKVVSMQIATAPPPPSSVAPEARIGPALEAVVMHALEKSRDRRFASAAEFLAALAAAGTPEDVPLSIRAAARRRWTTLRLATAARWSRLPARARLLVPRVGVPAAVLVVVLPLVFARGGPAAPPPAPRPVPADAQAPLRQIEQALGRAELAPARALVMQQMSAHPESARVRYLLGNLEFMEKHPDDGLRAYRDAMRLDPGFRGDAALLHNARSVLDDRKVGRLALDLIATDVGQPAATLLAEIASSDKRLEFRQTARAACDKVGCADRVDRVASFALDLQQVRSCDEKREAVARLRETRDARAAEALRKARRAGGGPLGSLFGSPNDCVRRDIDAALKDLE